MKNPLVISLILVLLIAVGYGAYEFSQQSVSTGTGIATNEAAMRVEEESMKRVDIMMKVDEAQMLKETTVESGDSMMKKDDAMVDSGFVQYSQEVLENAATGRRVLFFYASWCPTCKSADANFTQNLSQIPDDVTLIRVNYSDTETDADEKALAQKYGITYQHTFVQIDSTGAEIAKWNGGEIEELLSNIE